MITRRNLLVGSAAVLGSLSVGTPAEAVERVRQRAAVALAAASGFSLPAGLTCPVPFMSRAAWGADESYRFGSLGELWPIEPCAVQALTVHHAGFYGGTDSAATVRSIYRTQAVDKGWGDIGYHLLIDDAGIVYEGRYSGSDQYPVFASADRMMVTGAHVGGWNTGNIGVCMLGYLVDTPATAAAQDSLVTVMAYLAAVGGVDPLATVNYVNPINGNSGARPGLGGHRNWAATECPGTAEYGMLAQIRSRAAAAKPNIGPPPPPPPPPTTPPQQSPAPTDSATNQPSPPAPTTTAPRPTATRSEHGGDEYVPAARKATPSKYPTVRPSATATPSATTSATPTTTYSDMSWPTALPPTDTAAATSEARGGGWGLAVATAGGATAATALGGLGAWLLWRRRAANVSAETAAPAAAPTVDEQSATLEVRSAQPDEDPETLTT